MAEEPDVSPQALARMAAFGRRDAAEAGPAPQPSAAEEIERWRQRIDEVDSQLNRLLNARSACALEIGRVKRRAGLPIYAPEREAAIVERALRENPGPLDGTAVRRVFERIIDESRRLERLAGGDPSRHPEGAQPPKDLAGRKTREVLRPRAGGRAQDDGLPAGAKPPKDLA